ncbi:MAG: hypothetical protein ACRD21_27320, partial [Vicinamibacteria bacterium]
VNLDSFTVVAPGAGQMTVLVVLDAFLNCDSAGAGSRICSNAALGICDESGSSSTCGGSFRQFWYEDPSNSDPSNTRRLLTLARTLAVSAGPRTYYLNGRSHELGMVFAMDGYAIALFTPGSLAMTNP